MDQGDFSSSPRKIPVNLPTISGALVKCWTIDNATKAFLSIEYYSAEFDPKVVCDKIGAALKGKISNGLDVDFLENKLLDIIIAGKIFSGTLIAQGSLPERGIDALIEYRVPPPTSEFSVKNDGTVDFKNRDLFRSVQEGELLLTKHPLQEGKLGMDVFGKVLHPSKPKDIRLQVGKNAVLEELEDGVVLVKSASWGKVLYSPGTNSLAVQVTPSMDVLGDVDYSTGNIFFKGSVEITGSVLTGFAVVATGSIIIHGMVDPGTKLTAGGDVIVYKGIRGTGRLSEHEEIKAFGNLRALFAENATLVAEGDITLQSALGCHIRSNGNLFVQKSLFGGEATVCKSIRAQTLGNTMELQTSLRAGISHSTYKRLNIIVKILEDLKKQTAQAEKNLKFVEERGENISTAKKEQLIKHLTRSLGSLRDQIAKLEVKKADATIEILEENNATISAKVVHPGVMVFIRNSQLAVRYQLSNTTFMQKLPEETIETTFYYTW